MPTDEHISTRSVEGRLGYLGAKVRMLEKHTKDTFDEVKGSVKELDATLDKVNNTLTSIDANMVTRGECGSTRALCVNKSQQEMRDLDGRVNTLETDKELAAQRDDLTSPGMKVGQKKESGALDRMRKWIGLVVAVLGLLGYSSVATCVQSSNLGDIRKALQETRRESAKAAKGQQALQQSMDELKRGQPKTVPVPQPILIPEGKAPRRTPRRRPARRTSP